MKFISEPKASLKLLPEQSTVYQGDAASLLAQLPENFFRCAVTSPPYWGLIDLVHGESL